MTEQIVKWRPSNATIGDSFIIDWCGTCEHQAQAILCDSHCDIMSRTMAFDIDEAEYPVEWQKHPLKGPICTAHIPKGQPIPEPRCVHTVDMFEEDSCNG